MDRRKWIPARTPREPFRAYELFEENKLVPSRFRNGIFHVGGNSLIGCRWERGARADRVGGCLVSALAFSRAPATGARRPNRSGPGHSNPPPGTIMPLCDLKLPLSVDQRSNQEALTLRDSAASSVGWRPSPCTGSLRLWVVTSTRTRTPNDTVTVLKAVGHHIVPLLTLEYKLAFGG